MKKALVRLNSKYLKIPTGILYAVLACFLWAIIPLLIKAIINSSAIDYYALAFVRQVLAVIALLAIQLVTTRKIKLYFKSIWIYVGGLGLSVNFIIFNIGLKHTTATAANVLTNTTEMIFVCIFGLILLKEKMNTLRLLGIIIAIIGMIPISLGSGESNIKDIIASEYFYGNMLIIVSGIIWVSYAMAIKKLTRKGSIMEILIPILILGSLVSGLATIIANGINAFNITTWLSFGVLLRSGNVMVYILILGVFCTGFSYSLLNKALKSTDMVVVGCISTLAPVITALLASVLLKEALTLFIILGIIVTVIGTMIITLQERSEQLKDSGS